MNLTNVVIVKNIMLLHILVKKHKGFSMSKKTTYRQSLVTDFTVLQLIIIDNMTTANEPVQYKLEVSENELK